MEEFERSTLKSVGHPRFIPKAKPVSENLERRLWQELEQIALIDPHSHINPHAAASKNLGDILGYHYYTELAHSAGFPRELIEQEGITPKEKVRRLVPELKKIRNTYQYRWLMEICWDFFGFESSDLTESNWEALYDASEQQMASSDWEQKVLTQSRLEGVFLTNDFDDPLTGFDTQFYIPCLRTDDLVFHLSLHKTRQRLAQATGVEVTSSNTLRQALGKLFDHFCAHGAKACAISLPPDFAPEPVTDADIAQVVEKMFASSSDYDLTNEQRRLVSNYVFWKLTEFCADHGLPFDLMIGVNRGVYQAGVYQGRDLYDRRTSLFQYKSLLNAFPQVTFPISVLDHTANPELVSYAWIFPNVVVNGHWWYSNLPAYIHADCQSRLQGVPISKQIGYYSDMYKLEFALPKFRMYRKVLSKILAQDFVQDRGWSEEQALRLGQELLRGNVERIFKIG